MSLNSSKRNFLKTAAFSALLQMSGIRGVYAEKSGTASPIHVIIPKEYEPPVEPADQQGLTQAVLLYISDCYRGKKLPVWGRPFEDVNLEKRITNIVYWIASGIKEHRNIYPIDPAWVVAQIMAESFFYEFAISKSLAVGLCQFILPTAREYGILCAGDRPEHGKAPYSNPESAGKAEEYYRLKKELQDCKENDAPENMLTIESALKIIAKGDCSTQKEYAGKHLNYLNRLHESDQKILTARDQYRTYLQQNIIAESGQEKDIFKDTDFFREFDERFTYKKPISAMVQMLAKGLKSKNGNILASAAGYNAGLSRTEDSGPYKPYGKIPAISETATYLSHVLVNHYEIIKRIGE
ncbi:MAG: hypothetical protein BWK80_58725 [Desulfobacteraceae bacterium IS3]|nr:MAG: hypothetical protein BWK80_58725 [Desulfobacteraceae bacterium IS3]